MLHFINAETDRKIAEIREKGEESAKVLHGQIIHTDMLRVRKVVEEKQALANQDKQVAISRLVSDARMKYQDAQHGMFLQLRDLCQSRLATFLTAPNYEAFIQAALSEAILAVGLNQVLIQFTAKDAPRLSSRFDGRTVQAGDISCSVRVDSKPIPPSAIGGFILKSTDGKVTVDCTLAERLEQALKALEPQILTKMFPAKTQLWDN